MGKRKQAAEEPKPKKRRRGRGVKRFLFLAVIGGGAALVLSEDLRNKALDALFGSEQQFEYTGPSSTESEAAASSSPSV
jgi:hypothetical protein